MEIFAIISVGFIALVALAIISAVAIVKVTQRSHDARLSAYYGN
jgi:hypothetical protein